MHPVVAREILSTVLGNVDLTPYDFDGPLPDNLPMSNASQSTFKYVTELAKKDNLTMRQIAQVVAGARAKMVRSGHAEAVRRPHGALVRRRSRRRLQHHAAHLPGALNEFVEMVIPELQRRGLFRTEYTGRQPCASISACRARRAGMRRAPEQKPSTEYVPLLR